MVSTIVPNRATAKFSGALTLREATTVSTIVPNRATAIKTKNGVGSPLKKRNSMVSTIVPIPGSRNKCIGEALIRH